MELGGNAPFIVFEDADLDAALDGAMAAKMRNGGEACTAANRIYVQNSVREEFTARLTERVAAMTVGPGWRDGVSLWGDHQRAAAVVGRGSVADAIDHGARVRTGDAVARRRLLLRPTVLDEILSKRRSAPPRSSGQSPRSSASIPRTRRSSWPTARRTDSWRTSTRSPWHGPSAWPAASNRDGRRQPWRHLGRGPPFGGIKHSGRIGGGSEGIEEYLDTKYITLPPN